MQQDEGTINYLSYKKDGINFFEELSEQMVKVCES